MAHYRTTVRTRLSPDEAYDFMSDLSRFSEWDPGIKKSSLVTGSAGAVGSTYDLTVGGVKDSTMRYEIVTADAPRRVEARSTTSLLTSVDVITVAADGSGSVVTYDADLRLVGVLRLADPLLTLMFNRIGDRAAEGLRKRLDGTFA